MINSYDYLQHVCSIADLVSKRKERNQICSHVFCHVVVCLLARESIARKLPLRRCPTNQAAVQRNGLLTWTKYVPDFSKTNKTVFWWQIILALPSVYCSYIKFLAKARQNGWKKEVFSASFKREIYMVPIWLSWPVCIVTLTKEFYKNP